MSDAQCRSKLDWKPVVSPEVTHIARAVFGRRPLLGEAVLYTFGATYGVSVNLSGGIGPGLTADGFPDPEAAKLAADSLICKAMGEAQDIATQVLEQINGPLRIRCYDNGGRTADRYTVIFTGDYRARTGGKFWHLGSSSNPFHPQGIGHRGESDTQIDYSAYKHLGQRVRFEMLPVDVQKFVWLVYRELWELSQAERQDHQDPEAS